ncbi:MAG: STAS domain-containing protein [Planctomycetes bacterium]|nr:STAS domain-containing protein [Planctomycetota bacterium]
MDGFQIKTLKLLGDVVVIGATGTLDSVTAPELEKTVQKYLDDKIYDIIFDLSQLKMITSAGVGFFTKMAGVTSENFGGIVIVQPIQSVRDVLNVFGLLRYVPVANDIDNALKDLAKLKSGKFRPKT